MSSEDPVQPLGEKKIQIQVTGDTAKVKELEAKLAEAEAKASMYSELEVNMAAQLNEKYGTDQFSNKSLKEQEAFDKLLESQRQTSESSRSQSTGQVPLQPSGKRSSVMTTPYDTPEEMLTSARARESTSHRQ